MTTPTPLGTQRAAQALIARVQEIVAGLTHGEAGLIGATVALLSADEQDLLLARLLTCFGAKVVFLCAKQLAWDDARDYPLLRCLVDILEKSRTDLDLTALRRALGDPLKTDDCFEAKARAWAEVDATLPCPADIVIALGALPVASDEAVARLAILAKLVRVGGELEVFDTPSAPLPQPLARELETTVPAIRLGMRRRSHTEKAGSEGWRGVRLSLVPLAEPWHEYPVEGRDNPAALAHCQARLDFAANYVQDCEVLEAGSATGIGARLFLERGARRVVCLDRSAEALQLAADRSDDSRLLQLCRWDLNRTPLPFPDASFDVVVCLEVLEHISEQRAALTDFARLLRPGGRLIVSVPDQRCEDAWAALNRFRNPFHLHTPSRPELQQMLAKFAEVSWVEQRDFTGSAIIAENDTHPVGQFMAHSEALTRGLASVQVAVCTKAPLSAARPRSRKALTLRLYDNFSERQLGLFRHADDLRRQSANERQRLWRAVNRAEQQGQEAARLALHHVGHSGGVLVSRWPVKPGPWSERLAAELQPVVARNGGRRILPSAASYLLEIDGEQARIAPLLDDHLQIHSVILPAPRSRVGVLTLRRWLPHYVQEFWFLEENGWRRFAAPDAFPAFYRLLRAARRRIMPPRSPVAASLNHFTGGQEPVGSLEASVEPGLAWHRWIEEDNCKLRREVADDRRSLRITQYIGTLYCGGAERQLCNLSIGLKQRGHQVRVLTTYPSEGDGAHYFELLHAADVPVAAAEMRALKGRGARVLETELVQSLPEEIRHLVRFLYAELIHDKRDILHCWLDHSNIVGAIAGLLAGVPRILLSFRSVNPTHFPHFHRPFMLPWYRLLARSNRIQFVANSHNGTASYCSWIGLPAERVHIVLNGLCPEHYAEPSEATRAAARRRFGLTPDQKVVSGVFRIDKQKQPGLFLEVIRKTAARVPNLQVLLAGLGPLENEVRSIIDRYHLSGYIQLLGRIHDISEVHLASDVHLLTSFAEGCPNVVLEAQYLGVPVVATAAGGTCDAVLHGRTGYLAGVHDAEALTEHLVELLNDDDLRRRFAPAGRALLARSFSPELMVDHTVRIYQGMLANPANGPRIVPPKHAPPANDRLADDRMEFASSFHECDSSPLETTPESNWSEASVPLLVDADPVANAPNIQPLCDQLGHYIETSHLSAESRFELLRNVGKILLPDYRFHWPQLAWWQDAEFNDYLRRFGEIDGMNADRRWMLYQLLRLIENIPGDTAECGVYAGASSYLICQANSQSRQNRWHFLFDSFEGLSTPGPFDGTHWSVGDLHCTLKAAQENLSDFKNASFHPGWIPETFEEMAKNWLAFVHIDVDLYEPTRDSIAFFYPRMSTGGIILCDDYGFTSCPGATKAIDDFLRDKPEKIVSLPTGSGFIIKTAASPQPSWSGHDAETMQQPALARRNNGER
jgi:glycosyltransferase involved in cell wall biosynthesis/SAM-dependent methyltransferase